MNVLITGCGGYIGTYLSRTLRSQGHTVRGLDYNASKLKPLEAIGVEPIVADISENDLTTLRAAVGGIEVVYHLAGSALGDGDAILQTNVLSARNIAAVCGSGSGVRMLVFASSGALYPSGPDWLDEDTPPEPAFTYARSKLLAEYELLTAHARNGVPAIIARIAGVYGPGNPALMLPMVQRGRFPLIGGGKGYASYIHIDDLITALLTLPERGCPGQIYNLSDDEPVLIREFYSHLARLLDAPPPPSISPKIAQFIVQGVKMLAKLRNQPAPLPSDMVQMAAVSHRMRNRRMREELDVIPRYATYREGLVTCIPARS